MDAPPHILNCRDTEWIVLEIKSDECERKKEYDFGENEKIERMIGNGTGFDMEIDFVTDVF